MKPDQINTIQSAYKEKAEKKAEFKEKLGNADKDDSLQRLILEGAKAQIRHRDSHEPKVEVKNFPQIATPDDIEKLAESIDGLTVSTYTQAEENAEAMAEALSDLSERIGSLPRELTVEPVVEALKALTEATNKVPAKIKDTSPTVVKAIAQLDKTISAIELAPQITVTPTDVTVQEADLSPVIKSIESVQKEVSKLGKIEYPVTDLTPLVDATESTTKAINSLRFPIPNYILPFRDINGKAVQVQLDASGNIPTGGGSSSSKATAAYSISAVSDDVTNKYFFFEDANLNYYIMRKNKTTAIFTYTKGTGGYTAIYVSSTSGPSGSPTFGTYGATF